MESHNPGHLHALADPSIASTTRGLWAVKWSFIGLMVTTVLQAAVFVVTGSVALLADTIHNFADAATAIPLGIAFWLTRRARTRRFTYGLGRAEDLAGIAIIVTILISGLFVVYESINHLLEPQAVERLWAVGLAAVIGFLGNEGVAVFRIRVGRQIGSAALVADGYHATTDGLTSLAVLAGVVGMWAGYPLADPVVGLLISVPIFWLVCQSARPVLLRALDGVEATTVEEIFHAARHASRVEAVTDVRARWVGHHLHAEVSVTVPAWLSVAEGHATAKEVRHQLLHRVSHLSTATVHVDPSGEGGDRHHGVAGHEHDGLPGHSHH